METVQVNSSTISFIGYDTGKYLLMIGFANGEIYYYSQVAQSIYTKLLSAVSKEIFFNTHIKGKYNYTKVD